MGSNSTIALTSIGAKTIQNLRLRILPFVFLLFGIALLDRVNIGFMALTMNQERSITSQQYGLLFGIFFFGYFFFEIPHCDHLFSVLGLGERACAQLSFG